MKQQNYPVEIVVPCYNPLEGWHTNLISAFNAFQKSLQKDCTLILVNDGSVKGIREEHIAAIQKAVPGLKYISYPENRGKGYALRQGVAHTAGEEIILTDIDFPYTNDSMVQLYHCLRSGNDLALGYREPSYYQKVPVMRLLISRAFRLVLKNLMRMNVSDTQCGLKGLNARGRDVFLQSRVDGYLYDLEFVRNAGKARLKTGRTVVHLKDGIEFTNMKASVLLREIRNFVRILFH